MGIFDAEFNGSVCFNDLASLWLGMANARLGNVSWGRPYADPMVKLTFQHFYRCQKLLKKDILDPEFNGCVCLVIWRLCGSVLPGHVSGTVSWRAPITTLWSNWHSSCCTDAMCCIQGFLQGNFWMLISMEVLFGDLSYLCLGKARMRPIMTQWSNWHSSSCPDTKNCLKCYLGCWVQWKCFFGDLAYLWSGMDLARLLKGA